MQTLEQLVGMLQKPGDNLLDNETLFRLLQVDAAYSNMVLEREKLVPYLQNCNQLVKLLRSYNPTLPMAPGMAAQFKEIYGRIENGGPG